MSGSRAKALRRAMEETRIKLLPRGWRRLKRAWNETPRPERRSFDVAATVRSLRGEDESLVRKWLSSKPAGYVKALKKRILGK
jgi:hypothetical protein